MEVPGWRNPAVDVPEDPVLRVQDDGFGYRFDTNHRKNLGSCNYPVAVLPGVFCRKVHQSEGGTDSVPPMLLRNLDRTENLLPNEGRIVECLLSGRTYLFVTSLFPVSSEQSEEKEEEVDEIEVQLQCADDGNADEDRLIRSVCSLLVPVLYDLGVIGSETHE